MTTLSLFDRADDPAGLSLESVSELTARIKATVSLKGHDPIELNDTLSGPRFTGPMGNEKHRTPLLLTSGLVAGSTMSSSWESGSRGRAHSAQPYPLPMRHNASPACVC